MLCARVTDQIRCNLIGVLRLMNVLKFLEKDALTINVLSLR